MTIKSAFSLSLLITIMTLGQFLHAAGGSDSTSGPGNGGGGLAVLCYKTPFGFERVSNKISTNQNSRTEIDLELDQLRSPPIAADIFNSGVPETTRAESVAELYERLKAVDPRYYQLLLPYITKSNQWTAATTGVTRLQTAAAETDLPRNCILIQVAIYSEDESSVRYNAAIFKKMNKASQTAIKLHMDSSRMHFQWASAKENMIHTPDTPGMYVRNPNGLMVETAAWNDVRVFVSYLLNTDNYKLQDFVALMNVGSTRF